MRFLKERFRTSRKEFGKRKARLFVVACCRQVWSQIKDERARHAIEMLESYADGAVTAQELREAEQQAASVDKGFAMALGFVRNVKRSTRSEIGYRSKGPLPVWEKAELATNIPAVAAAHPQSARAQTRVQAKLLRDLFGNPFCNVDILRTHKTPEVVALADAIYAQHDFSRLPDLAVALRDAGCVDKAVLKHCQTKDPHTRGCWLVDLIRSKRRGSPKRGT